MKYIFAAAATLLVAAPAFAGQTERTFTRDGITYVYTSTVKGDAKILEGVAKTTGQHFHLVVHKGWVSGTAGRTQVSFRAPKTKNDIEVAQR